MLDNLLKWVASAILPRGYEVRVSPDKKLEVDDGKAKLKQSEKPGDPYDPSETARKSVLRNITDYEAARRATKNKYVKDTVLRNPELVGAESQLEAELKLDIASGQSIGDQVDNNPRISESEAKDMLGTEWSARWGFNEYGENLSNKINQAQKTGDTTETEATENSTPASTKTETYSNSTNTEAGIGEASAPSEAASTTSTEASEVSIDTETGTVTEAGDSSNSSDAGAAGNNAGAGNSANPN